MLCRSRKCWGELRKKARELSSHDSRRRSGSRRRLPCQDGCYSNIESGPRGTPAGGSIHGSGSCCHGVRVGNFLFLSGIDVPTREGNVVSANTIQAQTQEVLARISRILNAQSLSLSISAERSCSCPAPIIALDTAKRAKRSTKAFSPKMNFRRTPDLHSRLGTGHSAALHGDRLSRSENNRR